MRILNFLCFALLTFLLVTCKKENNNQKHNNSGNKPKCDAENYSTLVFNLNDRILPLAIPPYNTSEPSILYDANIDAFYFGFSCVHQDSLDNEPMFGLVFQNQNEVLLANTTYIVDDSFSVVLDLFFIAEPGSKLKINDLSTSIDELGLEYITHLSGHFEGKCVAFNTDTAFINVDFCQSWD